MKKAHFFIFLDFLQKIANNCHFIHFRGSIFFLTHPQYLWPILFTVLDCFIRFKMFDYAQKYKKGSCFLFFLIFLPKEDFFSFLVINFFSHTPSISMIYFFLHFLTVLSGLKCSIMLKNMKKDRFSYFSWFFAKNCPKLVFFFIFGGQLFFHTHPHYLWPSFVYSCGLFHQV